MPRLLGNPLILARTVPVILQERVALARKRITVSDPYKEIKAGQLFMITGWELIEGEWYCPAKHPKTGEWVFIHESLFDWSKPDFEVGWGDAIIERRRLYGGAQQDRP